MSEKAATDDLANAVIEAFPEPIEPAPDQVEETPSEEPVPRLRKESCQWDASGTR